MTAPSGNGSWRKGMTEAKNRTITGAEKPHTGQDERPSGGVFSGRNQLVTLLGFFSKETAITILVLSVFALSAATYVRNTVWRDPLSLWQDVVRKSPDKARGYNNLGMAFFGKGQYEKALEMYERAIVLNSSDWEYYINRGYAYEEMGKRDKAMEDFDKSIALNPRSYKAYANKGMIYGKTGLFNRAIEQFNKAIDINPDSALSYGNRGLAYSLTGDYDKALQDLNKAIELDNNDAGSYGTRGNLYLRSGNNELAASDFEKACALRDERACNALRNLRPMIRDRDR
jgi:tetratricopeptide (TPR) repeat protein